MWRSNFGCHFAWPASTNCAARYLSPGLFRGKKYFCYCFFVIFMIIIWWYFYFRADNQTSLFSQERILLELKRQTEFVPPFLHLLFVFNTGYAKQRHIFGITVEAHLATSAVIDQLLQASLCQSRLTKYPVTLSLGRTYISSLWRKTFAWNVRS